jgi:hypothetical protein
MTDAAQGFWFSSSLFAVEAGEDEDANPGRYGRRLAGEPRGGPAPLLPPVSAGGEGGVGGAAPGRGGTSPDRDDGDVDPCLGASPGGGGSTVEL